MSGLAFRNLLEAGDVDGLRRFWREVMPNMPQPETRDAAEMQMHMARTSSFSLPLKHRAYSHRWLSDRELPSQLPDNLRPKAERMYPRVVEAVGISVNTNSEYIRPALIEVRGAMEDAVEDCFANGDREPELVRRHMFEARKRTFKALFGR